jgi:signal transduction histidine kinase/ActR/RegA family two-component response regulator
VKALQSASSISRSRLPPFWIFAGTGLGILLSFILFTTIRNWEQREVDKRAADLAHEQAERLEVTIMHSMEVLYSIASLHAADGRIGREQFRQFVRQAIARQPELQALSWNPVVPAAQRPQMEAAAVADGLAGFQFREKNVAGNFQPAGQRDVYVPVYFIEPLDRNAPALGYDLSSDAERLNSMERARDSGKPVATAPVQLAQGPDNQAGFLVLLPVFSGVKPATLAARRAELAGFAVAVFRVNDLVSGMFSDLKQKGIAAELFDDSRSGKLLFGDTNVPFKTGASVNLTVGGRQWVMVFQPTRKFIAAESHFQSLLVLAGGLLFTLLTTGYLYGGWLRTKQVAAANAALQEEIIVRQRAEAAAEAANDAKSDFLASMSHEIRTPLNAILGYTQLMQRDPGLPPEQHDAVSGISASGQHLLGLINEILDLSKIEAGRMDLNVADFDLSALANGLAATFRPLCAQKKIGFRLEFSGDKQTCGRGDEGKLRQVLINLVGNAVKFTRAGEVFLRCQPLPGGRWQFEVIDTGLGVPDSEQEDIFKPFHQGSGAAHQGGTGLGLAIAQRQVELLGGKLELQSERGIGSRFFFCLPLPMAANAVQEKTPRATRLVSGQAVRALVVDDHRENRNVLGGMLSAVGCEVLFAADGHEALKVARENKPEIIFLDLLLPDLNGAETARRMLADSSGDSPKIIVHTASALTRHRDEALAAGCVDFIAKPFACEQLYGCLERHLGVRFERAEPAGDPNHLPLERVSLPDGLCERLMVSAELHSTTALKACLHELRQQGPDAARLAEKIRFLMSSYDMDGIQHLLSEMTIPAAASASTTSTFHHAASRP